MKHNNSLSAILLSLKEKKLHPNQKELDKDGDGDIDPKDFAMLRKQAGKINKKKDKEEVEEESVTELDKKTLGRYVKKASGDMAVGADKGDMRKVGKRGQGISKAVDKMTKEDTTKINELSKKTLGSYAKKAMSDTDTQKKAATDFEKRGMAAKSTAVQDKNFKKANRADDKFSNRKKGINTAIDKLTKESNKSNMSADKKPEEYTDEKGMKRTRMVPVDKEVVKEAMPSQADAIKALNKKTAAQKAKNTAKLKAAGKMMPTKESTDWPIYKRIMEKANHTSDPKTSEPMDSKLQPFEKKMVDAHVGVTPPNELVDVHKAIEKNLKTLSTAPIKQAARPNGQ